MIHEFMQSAGLEGFAEVGIFFFLFAFALVVIRTFAMGGPDVESIKQMPLEDDPANGDPS